MGKPVTLAIPELIDVRSLTDSSVNKDAEIFNGFLTYYPATGETQAGDQSRVCIEKRFAIRKSAASVLDTGYDPSAAMSVHDAYTPPGEGNLYPISVVGNRVYTGSTELTASGTRLGGQENMEGNYRHRIFPYTTTAGVRSYCVRAGNGELWIINSGRTTITKVSDGDYSDAAGADCQGGVSLDGYIFTGYGDTAQIINSDLNSVSSWTSGNALGVYRVPGALTAVTNHKNYVVGIKERGMELFFDAANASGSPLGRADGVSFSVGCRNPSSMWSNGDILIWLGTTEGHGYTVMKMENLQITKISTPAVERQLVPFIEDVLANTSFPFVGFVFGYAGHWFYVLNLHNGTDDLSLVYDLSNQRWYRWECHSSIPGTFGFPFVAAAEYRTSSDANTLVLLNDRRGEFYDVDSDTYQDYDGTTARDITFRFTTTPQDFGYQGTKTLNRLVLLCDQQTSASSISVSWSDDDGITFSTARTLDMSDKNPTLYRCGQFTRRIFRFSSTANTPIRIWGLAADVDVGNYVGGNG